MIPSRDQAPRPAPWRLAAIGAAALAGLAVGLGAVYGIARLAGNPGGDASACAAALRRAEAITPHARGEVAALVPASRALVLPDLSFLDASGQERRLAEWRGRTILLNLWATWCVPCRQEMPALDALQQRLGGPQFEVLALNIDTRDPAKPKTWLQEVGIRHLGYYADPSARVFQELKAIGRGMGLPTSILIDPAGCEIGHLAGPAEWASEDALTLVRAALGG